MNINNNNIDEILDLAVLNKLTHLYAADNQLWDIQVTVHYVLFFLISCSSLTDRPECSNLVKQNLALCQR